MKFWEDRLQRFRQDGRAYDVSCDIPGNQRGQELARLEKVLSRFVPDAQPMESVLDYGCGFGRFFSFWERRGYLYTGADILEGVVGEARRRNPDGTFCLASQLHEGIVPDIVFLSMTLQHLTDEEAIRILRYAKRKIVIDNARPDGPDYVKYRYKGEINGLLERSGAERTETETLKTPFAEYTVYSAHGEEISRCAERARC